MDIQFIEKQNETRPQQPRTMTEKFMVRFPRLTPTKERANLMMLGVAICFFLLSLLIVVGYNLRASGGF